jgi:enoyl-[acyl-carrier protein] reductase II
MGTGERAAPIRTRVGDLLGVEYPIFQAPMGYIARAQLASAVSEAGGLGIVETSSGDLPAIHAEIERMRSLTSRPFGINIPILRMRDPAVLDLVTQHEIRFVTTSAGDPGISTEALHERGAIVFHVVGNLRGALKSAAAGVDGLVVEGVEGGGFKSLDGAATMVLLPLVCSRLDLPVVAAGGVVDGRSMAAAFALGAEGVQMGTRMLSAAESPVHQNYKDLVISSAETDSLLLNREGRPSYRVLRTPMTEQLAERSKVALEDAGELLDLYFGGDTSTGMAFSGQVAGRIESVEPVERILQDTVREFHEVLAALADRYVAVPPA